MIGGEVILCGGPIAIRLDSPIAQKGQAFWVVSPAKSRKFSVFYLGMKKISHSPNHIYLVKQDKSIAALSIIDFLFENEKSIYIDIKIVKNNYILITNTGLTPMNEEDEFKIVKYYRKSNIQNGNYHIGIAKVVKIKGNKVVLKVSLNNKNIVITKNDKIEYK